MQAIDRQFSFLKDYPVISLWWEIHASYTPPAKYLSPNGIMVEVDGAPVACGFMYNTDAAICVFEFVVSDPRASKEARDMALDLLIMAAIQWAKAKKYGMIYTSVGMAKYIQRLEQHGFVRADANQQHMLKEI